MPSINQVKEVARRIYLKSSTAVINLLGAPGMGKSECAIQIGQALGLTDDRILVVHVNNHDVVDFTGVPSIVNGMSVMNMDIFWQYIVKGMVLIIAVYIDVVSNKQKS